MNRVLAGAIEAIALGLILVAVPPLTSSYLQALYPGLHLSVLMSYFFPISVLIIGAIIALLAGIGTALGDGKGSGAAKLAQGLVIILYFYEIFHGGNMYISMAVLGTVLHVELNVMLMVLVLYMAAALRLIQGLLIIMGK